MSIENEATILQFPPNIESMEDSEIVELFLTQLHHPSISHEPHQLAVFITHFGIPKDERSQKASARLEEINKNNPVLSDSKWDNMTNPQHDEYDELFTDIVLHLRKLVKNDEYQDVRQALFILQGTLISAYRLRIEDTNVIKQTVDFLCAALDD